MSRFLKEPLVQFVLGGALLYIALTFFSAEEAGEDDPFHIIVSEANLLTYLQYQDKAFDAAQAQRILDGIDAKARQALEDEYIRDEIMVREALALGLDQNDDVIQQRLIQKMDFIFQGFADTEQSIPEADLITYYNANKNNYIEDATATFTHIFFATNDQDTRAASTKATALQETLNANNIPFEDAGKYGDRFYFLKNYVSRPGKMIRDHFGNEIAEYILGTNTYNQWVGPLQSEYGSHLIMIRSVKAARIMALSEVANQVLDDLRRVRLDEARRAAFEKVAQKYTVVQNPEAQ